MVRFVFRLDIGCRQSVMILLGVCAKDNSKSFYSMQCDLLGVVYEIS